MADQQLNEKQLQALLRVKRYEQPPPAYFDGLLQAVQRRQREEMLRRPAWRLFFDRIGAFFASLQKDWSYVGSAVCVVMIGVGVIQMVLPRRVPVPYVPIARATTQPFMPEEMDSADTFTKSDLVISPNLQLRPVNTPIPKRPNRHTLVFPVHYTLDTQPSNHEPPTQVRF
jgi:hypothetical protein